LHIAASKIQAQDRVPNTVLAGLRDAPVHADPTEIAAVWAYGLSWRPVPVFQTYDAYTLSLDQANADSLRSSDGPTAVIRELGADPLGRNSAWASPNYMVALTCSYRITAETLRWQALRRTSNACGPPRPISEKVLSGGESALVPTARNPADLVVATFGYSSSAPERFVTSLLKPFHLSTVLTNGEAKAFVAGTASHFHLLHVPATICTRHVTNGGLDIRSLSFPNTQSAVIVHFYDISTH
jgi:hypothetical protein